MGNKPTVSEIRTAVKKWMLKIYSARQGADIRTQRKFSDDFFAYYSKLAAKYPDMNPEINYHSSQEFTRRAEAMWNSLAMRGPGVHW
jgi:hypothetical protein